MYLINKDETEHTGQVGKGDPRVTQPGGKGGRVLPLGTELGIRHWEGVPPDGRGQAGSSLRASSHGTGPWSRTACGARLWKREHSQRNTPLLLEMLTLGFDYCNVLDLLIDSR